MLGTEASEPCEAAGTNGSTHKHPLQHTWCAWVLLPNQSTKDNWQNSQMNVGHFGTVEDFWRLYNNIRSPSRLGIVDYSFFKKDIVPDWEDDTCRHGGRWIAKIDNLAPQELDELWLDMVLTTIGEGFGDGGHCVCGVVVASRSKSSKVALWLSEREREKVDPIGQAFRQVLQDAGCTNEPTWEPFTKS